MQRLVPLVIAAALLVLSPASRALGQDQGGSAPDPGATTEVLDPDAVIDPTQAEVPETEADGAAEPPEEVALPDQTDVEGNTSDTEIQARGYGSAADQSTALKRAEIARVESDCQQAAPPTSTMLGFPGIAGGDDEGSWGWYLLAAAAAAFLVAALAFAVKLQASQEAMGPLATTAALIGIVAALSGLAVQHIPGLKISEPPPPEATMEVGQIHPRITREEYATKTGSTARLTPEDRREVGNVIWIEVQLKGYQEKQPFLQYALYDSEAASALLPGTAKRIPLKTKGKDVESLIVPIWVGYPRSNRFKAEFRLLEDEQVQQMASTGPMQGSRFRYTCQEPA